MIGLLAFLASDRFAAGQVVPRPGNDRPIAAPYGLSRTADEPVAIAPNNDGFFGRPMDTLDLPHIEADPDFATDPRRVRHRARLNAAVEERLAAAGASHRAAVPNEAGVPCGPVHGVTGWTPCSPTRKCKARPWRRRAASGPRQRADARLPHAVPGRAAAGPPCRARPGATHGRDLGGASGANRGWPGGAVPGRRGRGGRGACRGRPAQRRADAAAAARRGRQTDAGRRNASGLAFGGPDPRTLHVGTPFGERIAYLRSPVAGAAPVQWDC